MPVNTHTELLNYLIKRYGLSNYCEIGVRIPDNNFDKIDASWKVGIDPAMLDKPKTGVAYHGTSDEYFGERQDDYSSKFDLIFIDGDHTKEQVKRDFENSMRCLNQNGFIVIHDTLPLNEQGTRVPRETKQWWGDVYKFAFELNLYPGIDFCTYDFDNGCTVVWKTDKDLSIMQLPEVDYEFYLNNKHLLRIRDCVD